MQKTIGVVGCGYWGKNLVRNFAQLGALRAICDLNLSRLQEQAQSYPGVRQTQRFEDLLEDDDIRGVVIATPAALHYQQAKAAILAGKDVFVEKPLALHYQEGKELVDLAAARQAILMIGHILEYHPAVKMLREIVHRGELGTLLYIYSNRLNLGKVRQEENILWSFAPHDISIICNLVQSEPEVVSANGGNYLQTDIEDVTVTNLVFPDNVRAHIFVSWLHPFKEQKLVVVGDKKMAVFNDTDPDDKLKVFDKGIVWENGRPIPRQISETKLIIAPTEPMRIECQHFLECMQTRARPFTDGANALAVLKVLEGSQISLMNHGQPVRLVDYQIGMPG